MKHGRQECFRTMVFVVGMFSIVTSGFLLVPMLLNLLHENDWDCFCYASVISSIVGILCTTNGRKLCSIHGTGVISLACFVWIVQIMLSAVPFVLSDTARLSFVDAIFEATSGLTTTGATVMSGLNDMSYGILLWRAMLNAMGGLGVITVGIFLLPDLGIACFREMYGTEGIGRKFRFGVFRTVMYITVTYITLILACAVSYRAAGMGTFDAICHALTTVSTGGFSNYDDSIEHFQSIKIECIAVVFMLLASCPFVAYIRLAIDRKFRSSQYFVYLCILAIGTAVCVVGFPKDAVKEGWLLDAIRFSLFSIVSLSTSTGYSNCDYSEWSYIAVLGTVLAVCGGCTGSTNSGVKMRRLQELTASVLDYVRSLLKGGSTIVTTNNSKQSGRIEAGTVFFLYFVVFCISSVLVVGKEHDYVTAITAVTSTLSNTGIGVGKIAGPAGDLAVLAPGIKLILSAVMFLGRLEIIPVMVFLATILRIGICWMSKIFRKHEKT
ncbi:MAG: TrkH family potassium uptake protein [Aaplasma endosymbiont of Hyalomma asiaticum]